MSLCGACKGYGVALTQASSSLLPLCLHIFTTCTSLLRNCGHDVCIYFSECRLHFYAEISMHVPRMFCKICVKCRWISEVCATAQ